MIIKIEERGKELIFDEQISKKKNTRTLSLSPEFATIFQASRILEIIRHETSHRSKPVNLTNLRNIFPILIDQFHRAMKRHISSAKNIRMNDFNPRAMPWSRAILSLSLSLFHTVSISPSIPELSDIRDLFLFSWNEDRDLRELRITGPWFSANRIRVESKEIFC